MKKNKIGTLFLISLLAIAGIGISYAGFSDVISVYGTVDTATVQLTLEDYSGTSVWKIWNCPTTEPPVYPGLTIDIANEVAIYRGFHIVDAYYAIEELFADWGCSYEKESSAAALPGNVGDVDCDVLMRWMNLFPCINFTADVIIHYTGTIPAHVSVGCIAWATGQNQDDTILTDLGAYTQFKAYNYTKDADGNWRKGPEITFPVQMHYCQYVGIEVTIHLPQNNTLQGRHGEFTFNINAVQWNDLCEVQPPSCPPPVFTTIDLEKQWYDGTWLDVNYSDGDFHLNVGGATQGPVHQWNLTLGSDTATTPPLAVGLHPFTLVGHPGTVFENYWNKSGVNRWATYGTWQYHMHQIITGMEPLFYVKYDGTNYMLVDGLHRDFFGVDQYFTIPSDYIRGVYRVNGILKSECGSTSSVNIDIWIEWMM